MRVGPGARAMSGGAPVIGIDVGASKIVAGVVDPNGRVRHRIGPHLMPDRRTSLVRLLAQDVDTLRRAAPTVAAVGVGVAGVVTAEGRIEFAANHGHWPLKLRSRLENACRLPVLVENDANAAAWAEASMSRLSEGRLLFLAAGTGLGSGVVEDGHLRRDKTGLEIGHVVVDDQEGPEQCPCGQVGCLEGLVSGQALAKAATGLVRRKPGGTLARRVCRAKNKTSVMIDAALAGDPDVVPIVRSMGQLVGRALAEHVLPSLPVKRIVVGGGLAVLGKHLIEPIRSACEKSPTHDVPEICPAALGPDAVLIGAALLARSAAHPEATSGDGKVTEMRSRPTSPSPMPVPA